MTWLSAWFVNNYVRRSVRAFPPSISQLFEDISTDTKLESAVSAAVDWRIESTTADMWDAFTVSQYLIAYHVTKFGKFTISTPSCICFMTELSKIDARLLDYFVAVTFLHIAYKVERGGLNESLRRALSVATDWFLVSSHHYNNCTVTLLKKIVTLSSRPLSPASECDTVELVELLQQTAVELMTIVRQIEARYFGSAATVVTTDFEALCSYKRGDYEQCLQLSTHSLDELCYAERLQVVLALPEFIPLLDDDTVSLTALTLIVNPECRNYTRFAGITQLTLSLYLMTQCQLKLRHSVTSLAHALDCIEVVRRRHSDCFVLNRLILAFIERKVMTYITTVK